MSAGIGIVGGGVIGAQLAQLLLDGTVPGAVLRGTVASRAGGGTAIDELARRCDVLVEAAGVDAVRGCVDAALARDCELVVCSVGAFADPALEQWLRHDERRDLVHLPSGAIGGLDLFAALRRAGTPVQAQLTTRKQPRALDVAVDVETPVFEGSAREAIARFPRTANVAVTLALATAGLDDTRVTVVADPAATGTRHVVEAHCVLGSYRFDVTNATAPGSGARTSALTVWSVLVSLEQAAAKRRTAPRPREEIPS